MPGRSWAAWGRALGLLLPPVEVAQVGCGEATSTIETTLGHLRGRHRSLAGRPARPRPGGRRGVTNVSWEVGEIERLPLADASVDVVLPLAGVAPCRDARALAEAIRGGARGPRPPYLDLRAHDGWSPRALNDRWLGFEDRARRLSSPPPASPTSTPAPRQLADYRGERFATTRHDLKGDNDLLVLTRPDVMAGIHDGYLDAGADIIETNTFNATAIAQADYGLEADRLRDERRAGAARARGGRRVDRETPDRPRFVAGAIGPTNRTLSISPDVNDPALPRGHLRRGARGLRRAGRAAWSTAASTCSWSRRSSTR